MSLAKIPVILAATPSWWQAVSPPPAARTAEAAKGEKAQLSTLEKGFGQYVPFLSKVYKAEHTLCMIAEIVLILVHKTRRRYLLPFILASKLSPRTRAGLASVGVTRDLLVGAALCVAGSLIRLAAYKEMGKLFTFHLTLREEHKLITTGPYAHVRHPSYTGFWILAAGTSLMTFGRGSVFRECGWLQTTAGRAFLACYLFERVSQGIHLIPRAHYEDEFLKKQFGEEWEAWAKKTPQRFIPYVW
ncbi:unnamed protein product [Peniophora sp. CBMAI 1063]|nr:unnamed protein product [Peniophora sp. CBMAI 1063]